MTNCLGLKKESQRTPDYHFFIKDKGSICHTQLSEEPRVTYSFVLALKNIQVTIKLLYSCLKVSYLLPLLMKVRELLKMLKNDGWIEKSQKGSHLQLIHPIKTGKVTVPIHGGDIPIGTLNSILKQAGLK